MPIGDPWIINQQNLIEFVMIDSSGNELPGLTCSGNISKNTAAANAMAGAFAETAGLNGHYTYLSTVGEADTVGIVGIEITAAGAVQQNLEYPVEQRTPAATEFDVYTVYEPDGVTPVPGVRVDIRAVNDIDVPITAQGITDAAGQPRTPDGNFILLQPNTYYLWRYKSGYSFSNPDTEVHT